MSGKDPKVHADSQGNLSEKSSEEKDTSNPSSPQQNNPPSSPTSFEKSSAQIDHSSLSPSKNTRSKNPDKRNLNDEESVVETSLSKKPRLTLIKCGMCPRNVPNNLLNDDTAFKKECSLCRIEYFNHQKCATNHFYLIVFNKSDDVTLKSTPENDARKRNKTDLISLLQWNCCKIPYYCSKCKQNECFNCGLKHSMSSTTSKVDCQGCHKKWSILTKRCLNASSQFPIKI